MPEGARMEVVAELLRCQSKVRAVEIWIDELPKELFLLADKIFGHVAEVSFRELSELIIAARLLADDQLAIAVSRVKPFGAWNGASTGAIEANPCSQFHERAALRKLGRLLELNPNPCRAEAVLLRGDGTDQHLIATRGGTDLPPISRGDGNDSYEQHRGQNYSDSDE
jgi:hypothetical protein